MHIFVYAVMKSSVSNGENWDAGAFSALVAMVNLVICVPVIRLSRSHCMSVTGGNCDSEFIKPIFNPCSKTKNSEYRRTEFGNPEFGCNSELHEPAF